jgi:hypothetical protein
MTETSVTKNRGYRHHADCSLGNHERNGCGGIRTPLSDEAPRLQRGPALQLRRTREKRKVDGSNVRGVAPGFGLASRPITSLATFQEAEGEGFEPPCPFGRQFSRLLPCAVRLSLRLVPAKRAERPPVIRRTIESPRLPNGFMGKLAGVDPARTGRASIRQAAPTRIPRTITRRSRREHERGDELFGMGGHD